MAAATSYLPYYGSKSQYEDIETGGSIDSPELRWGFIRKVYGILSFQVLLTLASASCIVLIPHARYTITANPWIVIVSAILPFILLCALSAYYQQHPLNLILLALFSLSFSVTLGLSCAFADPLVVVQALALTALITVSLTVYTFWAVKRGQDFSFLGPALFTGLLVLIGAGLLQIFVPFSNTIIAAGGAFIFSLYIIYDTNNLLERYSYDDYIWASLALYLDIINLFTYLLELLSNRD